MPVHRYFLFAVLFAAPAAVLAAGTSAPTVTTSSAKHGGGPAAAAHAPVPSFKKADRNGDGAIEWNEAHALGVPKSVFDREDYHHNGKLTMTEWQRVRVAMVRAPSLPAAASGTAPRVPKAAVRAMQAPHYATAPITAAAPGTGGQ